MFSTDALRRIRNKKIAQLYLKRKETHKTISLFDLIDYINTDDKFWLVKAEKSPKAFISSVIIYFLVSVLTIAYFLVKTEMLSYSTTQLTAWGYALIIANSISFGWAGITLYWEYEYFHHYKIAQDDLRDAHAIDIIVSDNFTD